MKTPQIKLSQVREPRKRKQQPCYFEVQDLAVCLKKKEDTECMNEFHAWKKCMETTGAALREKALRKPTTNYHLQRLARQLLRK